MRLRKSFWILIVLFLSLVFGISKPYMVEGENAPIQAVAAETPPEKIEPQATLIRGDTGDGVGMIEQHQLLIADGAVEVASERSDNSLTYELADGRKAILLSSAPITYQDRSGQNQFIDNSLVTDTSEDGYTYKNKAHAFSVFFPEQANDQADILLRSQTGQEIRLWQQGELGYENASGEGVLISQAAETAGEVDENTITYPERYPGVSEIFSVRYAGIKHSYEMARVPEFLSAQQNGFLAFQETMVLPQGTQILVDGQQQIEDFTTDKEIVFYDAGGGFVGMIPVSWAHENTKEEYDPENDANLFLTYRVKFIDDHAIMVSIRIPVEWLQEAGRTYPVTIDRSFSLDLRMNAGTDDGYQWGATSLNWDADFLKMGYNADYGLPYYFAHMTFHDVPIPQGSTIDSVYLNFRALDNYSNTCSFRWGFEDSDNSTSINYLPYVAERAYVPIGVWSDPFSQTWSAGQWYDVGNFSASLQLVIDRPGWSSGNTISLGWAPYAASGGYRSIYSFDYSGSAPYLVIEYTPDDNYEPNNTLLQAYDISGNEQTWLINIDGMGAQWDEDWYRIYVTPGYERVLIEADFEHSQGDIDIALYQKVGSSAVELAWSESSTNDEEIDFIVPTGDEFYYIRVHGENHGNFYDLWWDDIAPTACYTLSRAHTGSGMNPVASPVKSAACSTSYTYVAGEYITLGAAPDVGWQVGSWSGTNNNSSTSTTNYVTMPASNRTVTVNYEEIPVVTVPTPLQPSYAVNINKPTYQWTKVDGATDFVLQIYEGNKLIFTKVLSSSVCGADTCQFKANKYLPIGYYKWRVKAKVDIWRPFSSFKTFNVATPFHYFFNNTSAYKYWHGVYGPWKIKDGLYSSGGLLPGKWVSAYHEGNYQKFQYIVNMKRLNNGGDANRIVVRATVAPVSSDKDWSNYYSFQYTNDGYFSIWKRVNGVSTPLMGWMNTSAIHKNGWNALKVQFVGSSFKFYINNKLVCSGSDASLNTGKVGVGFQKSGTSYQPLLVDAAHLIFNFPTTSDADVWAELGETNIEWDNEFQSPPVP